MQFYSLFIILKIIFRISSLKLKEKMKLIEKSSQPFVSFTPIEKSNTLPFNYRNEDNSKRLF